MNVVFKYNLHIAKRNENGTTIEGVPYSVPLQLEQYITLHYIDEAGKHTKQHIGRVRRIDSDGSPNIEDRVNSAIVRTDLDREDMSRIKEGYIKYCNENK